MQKLRKGSKLKVMRIYIIRHADPDYEKDSITSDGHKEAIALAERLLAEGVTDIYSSPQQRALITAEYTSKLLNIRPIIEDWTREMWPELLLEESPWGSLAAFNIPGEYIRSGEKLPTHSTWHQQPLFDSDEIKHSFEYVIENSDNFLKRQGYERIGARYKCNMPNKKKIAVFCHGGLGLSWLAHLLEIPLTLMWSGFWLPPSSVTTVLFDERSCEWAVPRCIGLADVSHLYKAGLEVKPRGIVANFY